MKQLDFSAVITEVNRANGSGVIVRVPADVDKELPARSTVMLLGTVNGKRARVPLEPDGEMGHWFTLDKKTMHLLGTRVGSALRISAATTKDWPEPMVPPVLAAALQASPAAKQTWEQTTVVARWEWVRWFNMVKTEQAKNERPAKIISMLSHGKKRPCCFNRSMQELPKNIEFLL